MNMDSIRATILSLRCESSDRRSSFVPEGALDSVLTTPTIQIVLRSSKKQLHREPEFIDMIERGGKKTFAILICIHRADCIVNFVENEPLQKAGIDSKLPYYSQTDLESILTKADATEFFERQWEFTAPIFRHRLGHRCLHRKTIFPFIDSDLLGEGSFGRVYKEKLHLKHSEAGFSPHKNSVRVPLNSCN